MTRNRIAVRDVVAPALAALSDGDVRTLLHSTASPRAGIGGESRTVDVAGHPVFVKTIRLTDREVDAGPGDTRNLFDLPPWYHYGVGAGSTGVNAWREVAAHEMVDGWVVDDVRSPFPLLQHWRVLADVDPRTISESEIVRAVEFWAGSAAIEARIRALAAATTVVALFVEHVPFTVSSWLKHRPSTELARSVELVQGHLLDAAVQMRDRGMVHFDAHLDNVLTTGDHVIVSDFGLAAADAFQLDDAERRFLATHVDHDVAYCAAQLVNAILRRVTDLPDPRARNEWIRRCARTGSVDGIPDELVETVRRLAPTAIVVNDFYWELFDGHLETAFPADALATTLGAIGLG